MLNSVEGNSHQINAQMQTSEAEAGAPHQQKRQDTAYSIQHTDKALHQTRTGTGITTNMSSAELV